MSRQAKVNQIILIIIDDVRASHLFDLITQGKLPNMAMLAGNGISSENCITSFPSVTFPCYPNIITGAYSGYFPIEGSGIPGYHWIARSDPPLSGKKVPFIRNYDNRNHIWKIGKDLGNNCKTIFEQAGKGNFLSALNVVFRGSYFAAPLEYNTEMIFKTAEDGFKNPEKYFSSKEVPKITVIYIPATDELMHNKGFDHPEYINEIRRCDRSLGLLIDLLKKLDYYKDTAICIVSDHGNYKAQKVYDIEPFFHKLGLKQYIPKNNIGDFDANMGSIGFFNFRGESWNHHPIIEQMENFNPTGTGNEKLNLFKTLWKVPGIKFMYYRDDNNTPDRGIIHLESLSKKTNKIIKGTIEYQGHGKAQKTKYEFENEELFGYNKFEKASKLLDKKSHSIDEWLAGTYNLDFPMFIDQLPRYFRNPHSCDIMISTCGEYGFNFEHGKTVSSKTYSHDIATKESMSVPLIISGGTSELPNLQLSYCKTTDVVPTLLNLLGIQPHNSVVGKSLLI
jgi:predicted AlkP superfamily pyrophosphatase or phosphodiesterase